MGCPPTVGRINCNWLEFTSIQKRKRRRKKQTMNIKRVIGLFNTGVLDDYTPFPTPTIDRNYFVVVGPQNIDTLYIWNEAGFGYPNDSDSKWLAIAQANRQDIFLQTSGQVILRTSFFIDGSINLFKLNMFLHAGGYINDIQINGNSTGVSASNSQYWNDPIVLEQFFQEGFNIIDFYTSISAVQIKFFRAKFIHEYETTQLISDGSKPWRSIKLEEPNNNIQVPALPDGVVWYSFDIQVGGSTINANTNVSPSHLDTELAIYKSDGRIMGQNDDNGTNLLSDLTLNNVDIGTYYVAVAFFDAAFTNNFEYNPGQPLNGSIILSVSF